MEQTQCDFTEQCQQEALEKVKKSLNFPGKGVSCMVPGKYSREYTDYYLNQLADHFNFDFFYNRRNTLKLESNQRFKPYREFLNEHLLRLQLVNYEALEALCQECVFSEKSERLRRDMLVFDGLILNTKRSIDNFGFIVDRENKDEYGDELRYEFICFYDEYDSFFDHLNGITIDDYQVALESVLSWAFNDATNILYKYDECLKLLDDSHKAKCFDLLARLESQGGFFRTSTKFQFADDFVYSAELKKTLTIFEHHIYALMQYSNAAIQINNALERFCEYADRPNVAFDSFPTTWRDASVGWKRPKTEGLTLTLEEALQNRKHDIEVAVKRKFLENLAKERQAQLASKYRAEIYQHRLKHPESVVDPETLSLLELHNLRGELGWYTDMTRHNGIKSFTWRESELFFCIQYRKKKELEIEELESKASLTEDEYNQLLKLRVTVQRELALQKKLEESLEFYRDIRKKRDLRHIRSCDQRNHEQNLKYLRRHSQTT